MSRRKKKDFKASPDHSKSFLSSTAFKVLAVLHVVCPLLFFTNLTRNPYYTQIALLNISISLAGILWAIQVWKKKEWSLPRLPMEWPLLFLLLIAFLSTFMGWWDHSNVRIGIGYEALRIWTFTLINTCVAFFLPLMLIKPINDQATLPSIWTDLVLGLFWGGLWFFFHDLKDSNPSSYIWDPYGAILWSGALIYAFYRTRRGWAVEFFHIVFVVTVLASIYGMLQYMGRDIIWSSLVQPYGGRPVSSFGNPNFLSSYLMLVSPLALAFAFHSRKWQSMGYLFVSVIAGLGVLTTLTRSTYLGLFSAYAFMGLLLFKKDHLRYAKWLILALVVFVVVLLVFPKTPITDVQSPLARFTEIFAEREPGETYGPWHQRLLIWSSAWDMVQERLLLGKGWGTFELFYPFYQGHYLLADTFPKWRTHANNAHNILLEIWSQIGFLGTGMGIWVFVTIFVGGWKIFKRKIEGLSKLVTAGLLAGMVGMIVDNFMGNVSLFFAVPAFLFWWNMGSLYNEDKVVIRKPLTWSGKAILCLLMCLFMFVIVYFTKRWNQERYYFEGFKLAKANKIKPSIDALERGFSWFKGEVNSNYELGNSYARHAKILRDKGFEKEAQRYHLLAQHGYQSALDANPGYDEIYFNLGITHLQINQDDKAIRDMEMAVFINPLLEGVYNPLANQYLSRGQFEKAKILLEQSVAAFPQNRDLWNNLGYTYMKLEMLEQQIEAFRRSFQADPSFELALKNLYLITQKYKRPEPYLEIPTLIQEMEKYVARSDYARAQPLALKISELMPYNADAQLSVANIAYYLGKPEVAIEYYKKALKIRPAFMQSYINMAQVYWATGDGKNAVKYAKKAEEFGVANLDLDRLVKELEAMDLW